MPSAQADWVLAHGVRELTSASSTPHPAFVLTGENEGVALPGRPVPGYQHLGQLEDPSAFTEPVIDFARDDGERPGRRRRTRGRSDPLRLWADRLGNDGAVRCAVRQQCRADRCPRRTNRHPHGRRLRTRIRTRRCGLGRTERPGATNLVTGLAQAKAAYSPVIALAGMLSYVSTNKRSSRRSGCRPWRRRRR